MNSYLTDLYGFYANNIDLVVAIPLLALAAIIFFFRISDKQLIGYICSTRTATRFNGGIRRSYQLVDRFLGTSLFSLRSLCGSFALSLSTFLGLLAIFFYAFQPTES